MSCLFIHANSAIVFALYWEVAIISTVGAGSFTFSGAGGSGGALCRLTVDSRNPESERLLLTIKSPSNERLSIEKDLCAAVGGNGGRSAILIPAPSSFRI